MNRAWTLSRAAMISAALLFGVSPVLGNGGTLRVADVPIGGYQVSVFTDPTPARPDTLHVSVLVLRGGTGEVAEGVEVRIAARSMNPPVTLPALSAMRHESDDPRYYHNHFVLPHPGRWEISVAVSGDAGEGETRFELTAREEGPLDNPYVLVILSLIPLAATAWWLTRPTSTRS
jgi:hypothetical protein